MSVLPPFSQNDVLRMLFDRCLSAGSRKAWAEQNNISPAYVSDVLNGNRDPGERILNALGLVKVVSYEYTTVCEERKPKKGIP